MKKIKRLVAVTASMVLLVSAVPVFAEELSDKIYVSNAIENTLKTMGKDEASALYEKIAKGAYTQKFDVTLKDYTVPTELLEKDIFDGYSISNTSNVDPNTFDIFNTFSFKNPKGEALSLNCIFNNSKMQLSVPEIMENYIEIAMDQGLVDETTPKANVFDMKTKNAETVKALAVLTKEIEVKVIGANKADASLTEAKITIKAESLNKFMKDYMSLYQLDEITEYPNVFNNNITVDLLINKKNMVTGFSTVVKETSKQETYEYDEITYKRTTKMVTTNATISINGTYKNDTLEVNITALENEKKAFEAKITNQDVRDAKSKITSSKTNIVASAEEAVITMAIDTINKADGYTDVALVCERVPAAAKTKEDAKHTFTLKTLYKTVVGKTDIKVEMPKLDITIDGMVFNLSSNYSLASSKFVLPAYTSVKMEAMTEEETTELTNKLTIQAIKVLPQAIVNKLTGIEN